MGPSENLVELYDLFISEGLQPPSINGVEGSHLCLIADAEGEKELIPPAFILRRKPFGEWRVHMFSMPPQGRA